VSDRPPPEDPPPSGGDPAIAEFARRIATSRDPVAVLLRPLPQEAAARIAERAVSGSEPKKEEPANDNTRAPEKTGQVISLPRRRPWTRWLMFAAAAAVALPLVFGVRWLSQPGPERIAYTMEVRGDSKVRGDEPVGSEPVHLRPSTQLRIKLSPKQPLTAGGTASAPPPEKAIRDRAVRVLVVRGDKASLVTPPLAIAPDGAITIDAVAREALGEQANGAAELVVLVGERLPDDDDVKELARSQGQTPPAGIALLRRAVVFEGWGVTRRDTGAGEVELAGCEAVTAGPICEVGAENTIRFWVPVSNAGLSAQIDGHPADMVREAGFDGTKGVLKIPVGTRDVELRGPSGEVLFRLPVRPTLDIPAIGEAYREMRKNNLDVAEQRLALAEKDGRPEVALQALRVRARIERRRRNGDRAKELLEQAVAGDHASGRISDEIDDRNLLAYQHMTVDLDFAAAESELSQTATLESGCPGLRVDGDYYRGLLAVETGRLDAALHWLRRSSEGAARLGLSEQETAARLELTEVLGILGRRAEAAALIERSEKEAAASTDPCARARLVTSAAWGRLRGALSEEAVTGASRTAAEAVEIARAHCPDALAMSLLNLAYTEAGAKKTNDARAHLREAREVASAGDERFRAWSGSLAVELDVIDRPEDALSTLAALQAKGEASLSPELSFEAELGRARALNALGRTKDASSAFAASAAILDVWSELVPLGEGRESFFLQQEKGARLHVDFLVRQAEAAPRGSSARAELVQTAARAARTSLVRFFATLARTEVLPAGEQGAYRKSREAVDEALAAGKPAPRAHETVLRKARDARAAAAGGRSPDAGQAAAGGRSPDAGQAAAGGRSPDAGRPVSPARGADSSAPLTLLYHPIHGGWVGFAVEASGEVHMERLPPFPEEALGSTESASGEALSRALLSPFQAQIDAAKNIRVPAHGPMRRVAFEALPWKGRLLADAAAVTYGFDAASTLPEPARTHCDGTSRVLLVTDPRGDLPFAEKAGPRVQSALKAHGWEVTWLSGSAATQKSVREALGDPCTALFHYDGHARFEGRDGLRAALVLQDGALTVTDILTLPRVPEAVALLGCATGKDEGLGLSQAFLVRGAREVLASTDDVDDALSLGVAERLYDSARPAREGPPVLSGALSAGVSVARAAGTMDGPWWLFRVLAR